MKEKNSEVSELSSETLLEKETMQDKTDVKSDKQKVRKKVRRGKYIIIILCCFLALVLTVSVTVISVFFSYYAKIAADEEDYGDIVSFTDADMAEIPEGKVILPEEDIFKDKNVANILLIGTDERTEKFDKYARADSIMILSLNKKTHNVKLVSLERGMTVRIPGRKNDLLTHTFHWGGSKLVVETVRSHFNLDVDRYVRVNFSVFEKLVDEVGGVDVVLTKKEAEALTQYGVVEGKNHLNGSQALAFSRLRSIDSDWKRVGRQRKVIVAIKDNLKGKSFMEIKDIADVCLPYVQTNLTAAEFADLLLNLPSYAKGELDQMTIPQKGTYQGLGNVDFKTNSEILRDFLYE